VCGVLRGADGRVLLARRPAGKRMAGLWEFPGGKLEPGERPYHALRRELQEELGIRPGAARRLIAFCHDYPHATVALEVWEVSAYAGTPEGREGQALRWCRTEDLAELDLLPASRPIVNALRLPPFYGITDAGRYGEAGMLERLEQALGRGLRLVQLREKAMAPARRRVFAREVAARVHRRGGWMLFNGDPEEALAAGADGVHLSGAALVALGARPLPPGLWVAASCHGRRDLERAAALGCDFAVLSPLRPTPSHPGAPALGWSGFRRARAGIPLPVYALGGLTAGDWAAARGAGAQGVAMIRGAWEAGGRLDGARRPAGCQVAAD